MARRTDIPFEKTDHVAIVYEIALGLHRAGALRVYLELGTARGATFNKISPLAVCAVGVDINPKARSYINAAKNVEFHCCDANEFLAQHRVRPRRFSLVFIDADHSHKASWENFQKVLPLVEENGLVLLHDTYPPDARFIGDQYCRDTYKTAEKIRQMSAVKDGVEFVTLPFYYGITIVRKAQCQLPWKGK